MGRQQSLQPFLLALLFSLVVIHAAAEVQSASSRRPSAIEAAAAEHPGVTPKKLRALDTSFSRKVAAALTSEGSEGQTQVEVAALPADAADEWVESLTTKKKPTMGEWFKQLVEEIDEEYAAQEKEYQAAKHRSSREPHHADSPYTEPHDDYSGSGPSDEQYGRKGAEEEPKEGQHGPNFWLFEEHHPEEYSHSKPDSEPRYSEGPEYKLSYEPEHNTPHSYDGPEHTPTHDDYGKYGHEGTGREQYGRGPDHEQYGPGPEHEPHHRQYEEEHEPEQYKGEEQYGPEHPHKESEDVCVQEVARSNCVISDTAVTYTSSLGCCHTPYGERYYAEDKYPGEPDYPAYAALMIQRRNSAEAQQAVLHATARKPAGSSSSGRSNTRGSAGSILTPSKTMTSSPRTAVRARTAFASPHVFYPVGGKAECAWSLAYHDAVVVDEHTKQIGIASATCRFNGSMNHCGSPLCEGMTITISADVYSTYAVSKYAPSLTASDPSCRTLYDQRLGKTTLGGPKFLPTTSPLDRPTGSPSVTDSVSRGLAGGQQQQQRPGASSRSVGDMLGRSSAPAAGGSSGGMMNPVSSRPSSGSSVSDMLGRSKQQLGTAQPPAAAAVPSQRSVTDFIGTGKPQHGMSHGSGASGIRSHMGMGSSSSGSSGDIRSHIGSGGAGSSSSSSGIRSHMGMGGSSAGAKLPHNQRRHRGGHGAESQPEGPAAQPQPAIPQEPAPELAKEVPAATQPAPAAVPATPAPLQPTPEAKAPQATKPVVEAPAAPAPAASPAAVAAPQQQPAPEKKASDAKPEDSQPAPAKAAEPKPLEQKPVAKEPQPAAVQPAWAARVPEPTQTVPAWFAAVPEPRAGGPTQVRLQTAAAVAPAEPLPLGQPAAKAADTWGAKVPEPSASSAPAWFAAVPEPKKAEGAAKQLLETGVRVASVNGPFLTYGEERHEPAGGYRAEEERRSYAGEPHRGPGYAEEEEEEEHNKPYYDGPGAAPRYGEPQKPYYDGPGAAPGYGEPQKPYYDGPGAAPRYGEPQKPYYDGPGARYGEPEEPYHTNKPYSDDVESIADYVEADIGLYGGQAIVIAGVVTSVKGLPHGMHYTKGMVEHVAAFNGVSLSKKAYEALPYDTPHVKAGAYKVVFFEDDYADQYIP